MQGSLIIGTSGFGSETVKRQETLKLKRRVGLTRYAVANSEGVSSKTCAAATNRAMVDDRASRVHPTGPNTRIDTLVVNASFV